LAGEAALAILTVTAFVAFRMERRLDALVHLLRVAPDTTRGGDAAA
jgi:hypothetical protein